MKISNDIEQTEEQGKSEQQEWKNLLPKSESIRTEIVSLDRPSVSCWTALDSEENPIQIEYAKRGVEYFCPDCGAMMITKMGEIRAHHFAHKAEQDDIVQNCGGEGFRHFRVKTILWKMLDSVKRHHFLWEVDIQMERACDDDRPDILVQIQGQDALAIEIVDTHPPSDEKKERWVDRMLEIHITDWRDESIQNTLSLSARLLPYMTNFQRFTENIIYELDQLKTVISDMDKEIKSARDKHSRRMEELYDKDDAEYVNLAKDLSEQRRNYTLTGSMPNIWFGSPAGLEEHEQIGNLAWGFRIETDLHDDPPSLGDYVICRTRKGSWSFGILGERVREYDWIDENDDFKEVYIHRQAYSRREQKFTDFFVNGDKATQ